MTIVSKERFKKLMQVLSDNGIEYDEVETVAEACCYVLDIDPNNVINEIEMEG